MTEKERQGLVNEIRKQTKIVAKSAVKGRQLLVDAGICTPKGNLKKAYK